MYAISLWEPWASLIAANMKHWETRSWKYPEHLHGQQIAIHAAKRWSWDQRVFACRCIDQECLDWPMSCVQPGGKPTTLGKVLCLATLDDWETTTRCRALWLKDDMEFQFGDYSPGRYAWLLTGVLPLNTPCPANGKQGFWKWDAGQLPVGA